MRPGTAAHRSHGKLAEKDKRRGWICRTAEMSAGRGAPDYKVPGFREVAVQDPGVKRIIRPARRIIRMSAVICTGNSMLAGYSSTAFLKDRQKIVHWGDGKVSIKER